MRKITYLFVASTLLFAACTNSVTGYKIVGTVDGAADGDTVFIQKEIDRSLQSTDTAIIIKGEFTFEGQEDSIVQRYLTYKKGENQFLIDFFLQKGNLKAKLAQKNGSVVGTPENDSYQAFKNKRDSIETLQYAIYDESQVPELTEEQRKAKLAEIDNLQNRITQLIQSTIAENITNLVGISLLGQYMMSYDEIEPLLLKVPVALQSDRRFVYLDKLVKTAKTTAVGLPFTDFTMNTPDGKEIKLSDYAGKGKIVLVDFWASWCGPCRREMPTLVADYAKYKKKGFEIVGVSLDRSLDDWKTAIEKLTITWPQMSDLKLWDCEGAKLYAVRSIPYTVLIGKDGVILAKGLQGEELQKKLEELFK